MQLATQPTAVPQWAERNSFRLSRLEPRHLAMRECTSAQIHRCADAQMHKCTRRCPDAVAYFCGCAAWLRWKNQDENQGQGKSQSLRIHKGATDRRKCSLLHCQWPKPEILHIIHRPHDAMSTFCFRHGKLAKNEFPSFVKEHKYSVSIYSVFILFIWFCIIKVFLTHTICVSSCPCPNNHFFFYFSSSTCFFYSTLILYSLTSLHHSHVNFIQIS